MAKKKPSKPNKTSAATRAKSKILPKARPAKPAASVKLIHLLWAPQTWDARQVRGAMLDVLVPHLSAPWVSRLMFYSNDPETTVKSPSPNLYGKEAPRAMLCTWVKSREQHALVEKAIADSGFTRCAGYHVEESIYKEYGENPHAGPRYWGNGQRSPGVVAVTLMERPAKIPRDEWIRRWHGVMSPLSEAIQPRTRYVRNLVLGATTKDAPPFEGIVSEGWPSARHVSNPFLFYGARNPFLLPINMMRVLRAVTSFLSLRKIQTVMMGEYFIK